MNSYYTYNSLWFTLALYLLTISSHISCMNTQNIDDMKDEDEIFLSEEGEIFWSNPNHILLEKIQNKKSSAKMIEYILQKKADPNNACTCINPKENPCTVCPYRSLNYACFYDPPSIDIIKILLSYGADPNYMPTRKNKPTFTLCKAPLLDLCYKKNPSFDLIKLLLEYKADTTMTTYQDSTPLHLVCAMNTSPLKFVKLLIESQIHHDEPHEFQKKLHGYLQQLPETKNSIIFFLLLLKRKKTKIPKFVLFKIVEIIIQEIMTKTKINTMISAKTSYNKTAHEIAYDNKNEDVVLFFYKLEEALKQEDLHAVITVLNQLD